MIQEQLRLDQWVLVLSQHLHPLKLGIVQLVHPLYLGHQKILKITSLLLIKGRGYLLTGCVRGCGLAKKICGGENVCVCWLYEQTVCNSITERFSLNNTRIGISILRAGTKEH